MTYVRKETGSGKELRHVVTVNVTRFFYLQLGVSLSSNLFSHREVNRDKRQKLWNFKYQEQIRT